MAEKALHGRRLVAGRAAIAFRRAADEDAIRPEHCPLGVDHDPTAPRAAQIQPAHVRDDRLQAILHILKSNLMGENMNKIKRKPIGEGMRRCRN
jgi:hypothetical protein